MAITATSPSVVGKWLVETSPPDLERRHKHYQNVLPILKQTAKELGYALAIHGSMQRDLDLIAVPWVKEFAEHKELAKALQVAASGSWGHWTINIKPHGRVAYQLYIGTGAYLDLSVFSPNAIFFP